MANPKGFTVGNIRLTWHTQAYLGDSDERCDFVVLHGHRGATITIRRELLPVMLSALKVDLWQDEDEDEEKL